MKLVGIVGTNADQSTNRRLLQYMQQHFHSKVDIEICEIKDLPAFNEPEDKVAPTEVAVLSDKIKEADGVIISTPEYDHSIPAALKSAIEWLSYTTRPLIDKPVMIVGASHGALGSSRAQTHLRQILDAPELKARIMPSAEFLLGRSLGAFDENGQLIYPDKVVELEENVAEFLEFVEIINQLLKNQPESTAKKKQFTWEALNGGYEA